MISLHISFHGILIVFLPLLLILVFFGFFVYFEIQNNWILPFFLIKIQWKRKAVNATIGGFKIGWAICIKREMLQNVCKCFLILVQFQVIFPSELVYECILMHCIYFCLFLLIKMYVFKSLLEYVMWFYWTIYIKGLAV